MFIYAIKNEKLSFFNRPIYAESPNEVRSYVQNILMSDADRALVGLKDDLALYELGEIDFVTGKIHAYKTPFLISDLAAIFDSIPKERIPRFEKEFEKAIQEIRKEIKILKGENLDDQNS